MDYQDLLRRFPSMRPIGSPPSLFTINGIGTTVYGARDRDYETGTFVKTHCLTFIFVPIVCLGAYRVANAPQGWYFLGKEPLSVVAKLWNALVVLSIVGVTGFVAGKIYLDSPDYRDGQKLAQADKLAADGQLVEAARLYSDVADGSSKHTDAARQQLGNIIDKRLDATNANDAASILKIAVDLKQGGDWSGGGPDLQQRAAQLAIRHAAQDPLAGMNLLETVAPLSRDDENYAKLHRELLEKVVAANPKNVQYASDLATLLEEEGDTERCRDVLQPVADQLGTSEGARVLGQILAREGKLDEAHALLVPYTEGRLQQLHAAEQALDDAFEAAQNRAFNRLKNGIGPSSFYSKYDSATEQEQQSMVNDYIVEALKNDSQIKTAQQKVIDEAKIVPVALDLGIVLLRRAQSMPGQQRQAELTKAEKTFLAIRGVAGESDEYKIFLGQVYYWLGKHDEGQVLFDELLETNERDCETLTAVGSILREVGSVSQARDLMEEAYEKADSDELRYAAAQHRALLWEDLDDEIHWLGLANPESVDVQASLATSQAQKAMREGNDDDAQRHIRQAIDAHNRMPENATTLNNSALSYFTLYQLTGDRATLDEVVTRLEKAVALKPSDSILLFNVASLLQRVAVTDVIGDRIDVKALKMPAGLTYLPYLYHDQAGEEDVVAQLRDHDAMKKAIDYLEKMIVLAPKQAGGYQMLQAIYTHFNDTDAMRELLARIDAASPDFTDSIEGAREYFAGTNHEKLIKESRERVDQLQQVVTQRQARPDLTFAAAQCIRLGLDIRLGMMDQQVDADQIVKEAEATYKDVPCYAAQKALMAALLFRADGQLRKSNQGYAELAQRAVRSLDATERIAVAMGRDEAIKQSALNHPDVQRVLELIKDEIGRFPKNRGTWDWAMLRAADPAQADEIIAFMKEDQASQLSRLTGLKLAPASADAAISQYWFLLATGHTDEAKDVLRQTAKNDVPLPFDP